MSELSFEDPLEKKKRGIFPIHRVLLAALFFGMLPLGWADAGCNGPAGVVRTGVQVFTSSAHMTFLLVGISACFVAGVFCWFATKETRAYLELVAGIFMLYAGGVASFALLLGAVFDEKRVWPPATLGMIAVGAGSIELMIAGIRRMRRPRPIAPVPPAEASAASAHDGWPSS